MKDSNGQSGQAITEYLLILSVLVAGFFVISRGIRDAKIGQKLTRPMKEEYARAYKYGDIRAKGYDEGGPEFHPRARSDQFRIFFNPGKR